MKLYSFGILELAAVIGIIYGVVTADRAVEGGSLDTITKDKVVAVVKQDGKDIKASAEKAIKKAKEELAKVKPSKEVVINE